MDLQLEKQRIKQELDTVNDQSVIWAIEHILGLVKDPQLRPLTKEDIVLRTLESEKAIQNGEVITLELLEEEMKNW